MLFFFSFFSFLFKISTADRFSFRNQTSNKYYLATFFFSFLFFFFLFFLFLFYKNKRTIKSLQWGGDKKSVTAGPSPGLGTATRTQRALRTSNVVRGGGDANRVTRFKNREKSKKPTPTEAHRSGPRGARRPRGCDTAQRSDGARRGVYVQSPKDTKPTGRDRSGSGGGGSEGGGGDGPLRPRTDRRPGGRAAEVLGVGFLRPAGCVHPSARAKGEPAATAPRDARTAAGGSSRPAPPSGRSVGAGAALRDGLTWRRRPSAAARRRPWPRRGGEGGPPPGTCCRGTASPPSAGSRPPAPERRRRPRAT